MATAKKDKDVVESVDESRNGLVTNAFSGNGKGGLKLSEDFKKKYISFIQGRPAVTSEGLTILGHAKGIWKFDTEVLQFPNSENNNTCICKTTIGGYDWDPIENKIVKVEYSDIGDASPANCTSMVSKAFIRMASTRSAARALRKYTNYDMLSNEELSDQSMFSAPSEKFVTTDQLNKIKTLVNAKSLTPEKFNDIMLKTFNTVDFNSLLESQGEQLIEILTNYVPTNS